MTDNKSEFDRFLQAGITLAYPLTWHLTPSAVAEVAHRIDTGTE